MEDFKFGIDHKKHDVPMDVFRIFMGLALMAKGGWFISHFDQFVNTIVNQNVPFLQEPIAFYVIFAHMIGGFLIFLGLHAREAAILNMPALIGAMLFVHFKEGLFTTGGLELTTMTFVALFCVAWHGSGKISLDNIFRYAKASDVEEKEHYDEVRKETQKRVS